MRVLKVVAEGLTTSFRYPHFMQQIHPTFEMPPPATIYGHIASALGEWFDPTGVQFAYHFTYTGQVTDIEHILVLSAASGYLKDTKLPKVLEGNVNPFERTLLFQPRLTLYINRPDWEPSFRSPRYPVALGRSQDLFTYVSVETIDLKAAEAAYFEHTLLPYNANNLTTRGYAVTMPRYLDYVNGRQPTFSQYFILRERVDSRQDFLHFGERPADRYWVDPNSSESKGIRLGLAFLNFVGNQNESITAA